MKTILLTILVWTVTASLCYGQNNAVREGSSEFGALQGQAGAFALQAQQLRRAREKAMEVGRTLFGADKRWSDQKSEVSGTLFDKRSVNDFQIDDWGCVRAILEVVNKVDDNQCLVITEGTEPRVMLLRGLDMSKVSDGAKFILHHPVVIQETYSYTSVGGAKKTVIVLECNEKKFDEVIAKNPELVAKNRAEGEELDKAAAAIAEAAAAATERQAADAALTRTWKDRSGKVLKGKFAGIKNGMVQIETWKRIIGVPLASLSKEDQAWVRDEMKNRREQEAAAKKGASK